MQPVMVGYPAFIQYPGASSVFELLLGLYVPPTMAPDTGSGYVPVYHTGFAVMPAPAGPRPTGELGDHARSARSTGGVAVTVSSNVISAALQAFGEPGMGVGVGKSSRKTRSAAGENS